MKKINIETLKKYIAVCYMVYLVAYVIASAVTLMVLYKDQIVKVFRRICLKMFCMLKRIQNKLHPTKVDAEWLEKEINECTNQCTVDELFSEEYACSEE